MNELTRNWTLQLPTNAPPRHFGAFDGTGSEHDSIVAGLRRSLSGLCSTRLSVLLGGAMDLYDQFQEDLKKGPVMARLDMIQTRGQGDVPRDNFVVVPGIAGANLDDRTCPHFRPWLDRHVVHRSARAQCWVYNHYLKIHELESWDDYSTTGFDLLSQLLCMYDDGRFRGDDNLILIGHKMGCYILKKALVNAWNKEHRPAEKQLLDMVETIIMIGEPRLEAHNQWEWVDLVSKCVSRQVPLPTKLAKGHCMGSLHAISESFEDALLHSTLVNVNCAEAERSKRWFRKLRHKEHDGCLRSGSILIRCWTTASDDELLEKQPGDENLCTFHPQSPHSRNLLLLNSVSSQSQILEAEMHTLSSSTNVAKSLPHHDDADIGSQVADNTQDLLTIAGPLLAKEQAEAVVKVTEVSLDPATDSKVHEIKARGRTQESYDGKCLSAQRGNVPSKASSKVTTHGEPLNVEPFSDPENRRKRKLVFSNSMPPRDSCFFGRTVVLNGLSDALVQDNLGPVSSLARSTRPHIVWLTGLPGIGKTAIVTEFVHRHARDFELVLWMAANSRASLGRSCHDFAVGLGLVQGRTDQDHATSRSKLFEWLATCNKKYLLVFDDLDSLSDLASFLPEYGTGSIVATSRREIPEIHRGTSADTVISLSPFTKKEAFDFLTLHAFQGQRPEQIKDIKSAAHQYFYSPLIIRHLANWSSRKKITTKDINRMLRMTDHSLKLLSDPNTLVLSKVEELDANDALLFRSLCLLNTSGVQERILLGAQRSKQLALRRFPQSSETLSRSLSQLWKLSLIDTNEEECLSWVPHAIQDAAISSMGFETWTMSLNAAAALIQEQWPSKRKFRNIVSGFWPDFDHLHSHAWSIFDSCHASHHPVRDSDNILKRLLMNSIWYNARLGNHAEDHHLAHFAYRLCSGSTPQIPEARTRTASPLPRRCIFVGDSSATVKPRLVDTTGRFGSYAALSYAWGGCKAPTMLNSSTSENLRRGINASDLLVPIRDAIIVTRNLGITFLWVDSLCILQDSVDDVLEEVDRMAETYSRAACIIADTRPNSATQPRTYDDVLCLDFAPYSIYGNLHNLGGTRNNSLPFPVSCRKSAVAWLLSCDTGREALSSGAISGELDCTVAQRASNTRAGGLSTCAIRDKLDEANKLLLLGSFIEATASLTLLRDSLALPQAQEQHFDDSYALATAMLGTAYHLLGVDRTALAILRSTHKLCSQLDLVHADHHFGIGRLLLAMSVCLSSLGEIEESIEKLVSARGYLSGQSEQPNEWSAAIDLKLAENYKFMGNFKEAHKLIGSSLEYFQDQDSETKQAHLARVLHRQSLIYEAQGSQIMHSAFLAAARETLIQRKAPNEGSELTIPKGHLTKEYFDGLVEPWYR